jgi:hypothetical protein
MPRNSAGQYTNPVPNFAPGSRIDALPMNNKFADVYAALSSSLDRYGQGGMQAPFLAQDGSAVSPSITFTNEPATGFYRGGLSNLRLVEAGSIIQEWALTYVNINRPLIVVATVADSAGVTATGNGTGSGGAFLGGTGVGNATGANGVTATGGMGAGSGAGGVGGSFTGGYSNGLQALGLIASGGITCVQARMPTAGQVTSDVYNYKFTGISTAINNTHPLVTYEWASPNTSRLTARTRNRNAVSSFADVEVGWSYDVDNFIGIGSQIFMGALGVRINRNPLDPATATTPMSALTLLNGYLSFADTVVTPNSNVGAKNTLNPKSFPKAWANIEFTSPTAVTVSAGDNIQSVSVSSGIVTINFVQSFKTTKYSFGGAFTGSAVGGYGYPVRRLSSPATASQITIVVIIVTQDGGGLISTGPRGSFAAGDVLDIQFYGEQ